MSIREQIAERAASIAWEFRRDRYPARVPAWSDLNHETRAEETAVIAVALDEALPLLIQAFTEEATA